MSGISGGTEAEALWPNAGWQETLSSRQWTEKDRRRGYEEIEGSELWNEWRSKFFHYRVGGQQSTASVATALAVNTAYGPLLAAHVNSFQSVFQDCT